MGQNETTTNELLLRIKEKYKKMLAGRAVTLQQADS